jgi:arginyl-tRNA synthetase
VRAEAVTRTSRLALSQLTGRVLHVGLDLRGITTPERM